MELKLDKGEMTDQEFLAYLKKKFKHKANKNKGGFTINDVNQYCIKKQLPDVYGGQKLNIKKIKGKLRVIKVMEVV